jgi:Flp pilus assembly protein TadD
MTYRPGGNRDLRSIASALEVAHVVEGTVRRDGNRVRITIRLVDARTDEALWSESYDRDLTDIFAIQSNIAQTVAIKLSAQLSPKERKDIEEKPTKNLETYDLYLQGKESIFDAEFYSEDEHKKLLSALGFLEAAIRKDSTFALAYCLIAKAHDDLYGWGYDRTNNRRALGDAAVNEALRLGRDLPETHLANAFHLYVCYRNHERARVQIGLAQQILPNSPAAFYLAAIIDRRQGRWETSTAALERACNLDPRNSKFLTGLSRNYNDLRRYQDAEKIYDRLIEFEPNRLLHKKNKAFVSFLRTGDVPSYRAVLEALPSSLKDIPDFASERFDLALCAHDWAAAKQILNENANEDLPLRGVAVPRQCGEIWLAAVQGNGPAIGDRFGAARDQLKQKVEANPEDSYLLSTLGVIDAILGRKDEAIQEATRAVDMKPASQDVLEWVSLITNLAVVYAWTNEPDLAFRELLVSTQTPGGVSYGHLKVDYALDPLRKDQRFEKLLAQMRPAASCATTRRTSIRRGPKRISIARLPVTGRDVSVEKRISLSWIPHGQTGM